MPTSESQKRANEKYSKSNATVNTKISKDVNTQIEEYCKQYNITKKKFLEDAIMEYLDRH